MTVTVLRELFRHIQQWRVLAQEFGVDTLLGPDGESYNLWDIEYLLEKINDLPPQQRRAIKLCLVEGWREVDAAVEMGVSPTNPVAMYASAGLRRLVSWIDSEELPRFRPEGERVY